jgi:SEL1 protein
MPSDEGFNYDLIDDGIIDSLLIISIVAALVALIYYRNVRQGAHLREQQERARQAGQNVPVQQPDRGLFPQPGDPAFQDWVVGGIGH